MNVALVHDWLVTYAGSERVLEAISDLFPAAPIFTTVYDAPALAQTRLAQRRIVPSFLQRFPFRNGRHRRLLPLMPYAVEQIDLGAYDVVISSSHSVSKGVLTRAD